MEDKSRKQPLLSVAVDRPISEQKAIFSKRRFRRCRSVPAADFAPKAPENGRRSLLGPAAKSIFDVNLRPNLVQIAGASALYLTLATASVYFLSDQMKGETKGGIKIVDALYFSIVTMTTVGYGDLVPGGTPSKLLACALVFAGMAVVAFLLSEAADYFADRQEELVVRALHVGGKVHEVDVLNEMRKNKAKHKLVAAGFCLAVLVGTGTLVLWKVEGLTFVDSFYCVCSTVTTLGYGDKSFSTEGGRAFAVVWILASTTCVAQVFLYVAEFSAERRQHSLAKWVLQRRLTYVDLQAADFDEDGNVSAPEFIIYKLKEMGKICQDDIAAVLEEFEDLDADRSGALTPADLLIAESGR